MFTMCKTPVLFGHFSCNGQEVWFVIHCVFSSQDKIWYIRGILLTFISWTHHNFAYIKVRSDIKDSYSLNIFEIITLLLIITSYNLPSFLFCLVSHSWCLRQKFCLNNYEQTKHFTLKCYSNSFVFKFLLHFNLQNASIWIGVLCLNVILYSPLEYPSFS
jgi:hypothetical protein